MGGFADIPIQSSSDELLAPIPNLRAYYTHAFTDKLSLTANLGLLSLTYEDYDGQFKYVKGQMEYRFSSSWGIGIGAQYTDLKVEHDSGGGKFEEYEVDFTGGLAFVTYSF